MRKIFYLTLYCFFSATLAFGQTTIYTQDFGTGTSLPTGWTTASAAISASTTNPSNGYTGASGAGNLAFDNSTTGDQTVTISGVISTIGFASISINVGQSSDLNWQFPAFILEWSPDGTTWTTEGFTDASSADDSWSFIQMVSSLGAGASGQSNLRIRITMQADGNGGIFRIDDFIVKGTPGGATTYYSKSTGNLDVLSTWGTNTDGNGTAPSDFLSSDNTFSIQNNASPTIGANWTVSGTNSKVIVQSGSNFTIPSTFSLTGTIDVASGGILTINNLTLPTLGTIDPASTIVFGAVSPNQQTIPANTYGNLTVQSNTSATLPHLLGGSTIVEGTLTLNTRLGLNNQTLTINGNLVSPVNGFFGSAASNLTINGTGTLTDPLRFNVAAAGRALNTLTINRAGSGTVTLGTAITINTQLNLQNGTFIIGTNLLTLANANINSTSGSIRGSASSNITFTGTGTGGTLNMDQSSTANSTLNNLIVNRTLSLGSNLNLSGTLTLNNPTSGSYNFTVGAHTLTLNGPSVVSNSATIFATSASSNLVFGPHTGSVTIPNSVTQLNNLTTNNSNAVTLQSSITVNGALSLQSGTLIVGTNALTLKGTVSTTSGALTSAATGLVDYAQLSNGQNVVSANYGSLTFSDYNKTLPTSLGIAGTFTPGTATGHSITLGSTINYNGTSAQTIAAFDYSNLTSSNGGARTLSSTGTINISRVFTPGSSTYTVGTSTINFNGGVGVLQTIPASFTYYNLSATNGGTKTFGNNVSVSNNLTIGTGATLGVSGSNYGLTVGGNWANSGTFSAGAGTVTFNKAGTQTISGTGNSNFYNLTKSTASALTLSSAQNLTNLLTVASGGTFNSAGFLTLVSNASGTARIGDLTGVTFTGNLTVQRYIDGGIRSYRFLGSPTQTFNLNQLKDNVFITGSTAAGFDANANQTPSAHTLDASTNTWVPITSLTTTLPTGTGFRIFVRGDRTQTTSLADASVIPNPVTLDFTGTIQKDDVTLPTSSAGQRFNLVGNPYPCTIDWKAAGWIKTNIDDAVYVWKPAGNNTGAYATYINGAGVNGGSRYIASSQGFIVHVTTAAASQLTVSESAKVTAQDPTLGFRTADDQVNGLKVSLSDGQSGYTDEALIRFVPGATRLFDRNLDAFKLDNPGNDTNPTGLNVSSWVDEATNLAVNTLPELVKNDTISLRMTAFASGKHQFDFSGLESFTPESDIFLYDSFTHTSTNIKFNPTYSFTVNNADVTTYGNGRFKLVFALQAENKSNTLVQVKAYPNPNEGHFTMEISNPSIESVNWEVCDALGRVITKKAYPDREEKIVEVVNLTSGAGMYFLKVKVGQRVVNQKLVVR